ncbi:hypothetical protein ABZV93_15320 [Actinopolymorpha sp. NPDC004070]|uniref:hypothetical protein n=1 Tax=Actinopolymorpha sp. NPDC004070 TaxID=3154548 RepID=UPI0033AAE04A
MRTARRLPIVAMGALLGLDLVGTAQASIRVSPQARENTLSAMQGEAFAYSSYSAYAQQAARTGRGSVGPRPPLVRAGATVILGRCD